MKKLQKEINWYEPSTERNYYIDLEYQGRIWVTKEMYQRLMKDNWSEWKRNERISKCRISNGHGGIKRCDKKCEDCIYFRSGETIYLDELYEKYEFELADFSSSIVDQINKNERNEVLWKAVSELDSTDQKIIKMFSLGVSEREIAKELGISRTTINYRKKVIIDTLRKKLQGYISKL